MQQSWNPTSEDLESLAEHVKKKREERLEDNSLGGWELIKFEKEERMNPVIEFNIATGNRASPEDSFLLQLKRIKQCAERLLEEAQELKDGVDKLDFEAVLDGALDVKYVLTNLLDTLEQYNFKVGEGWDDVCDNNSLKYTTDHATAWQWRKFLDGNEIKTVETDEGTFYSLMRKSDGKVMKFDDFPKVDLSRYVPEEFRS